MGKLRVLDLFSGIGGFSLGLERTGGFSTVAFCEIEEFPRKVLAKHWPEVPIYEDVTTADFKSIGPVDVVTAGFPCQDISYAGTGAGLTGERSGLFWHILRAVRMVGQPKLLLENVAALLDRGMGSVLGALAQVGYDAEWHCIPASYVGAPQLRDRVWIIADPYQGQHQGQLVHRGHNGASWTGEGGHQQGREAQDGEWVWPDFPCGRQKEVGEAWIDWAIGTRGSSPLVVGASDGLRSWLDRDAALGNAVVPQIPEMIGHAILEAEGV